MLHCFWKYISFKNFHGVNYRNGNCKEHISYSFTSASEVSPFFNQTRHDFQGEEQLTQWPLKH